MSFVGKAIGKLTGADAAAKGAQAAANTQAAATDKAIREQRRQFDALQRLMKPFVDSGTYSVEAYNDLLGTNGAEKQQAAISELENSPQFSSLVEQGENAMLQNASATGGLRGGNMQGALAEFRPSMLSSLIEQQMQRYGGLMSLGQNAAAGVGNAGIQTGANVGSLLNQQGAALAGGQMARAGVAQQGFGSLLGGVGAFLGAGGIPGIKKSFGF